MSIEICVRPVNGREACSIHVDRVPCIGESLETGDGIVRDVVRIVHHPLPKPADVYIAF